MPLSDCHIRRASARFQGALGADKLEALGRATGFVQRRRVITATSVFWALMLTLGTRSAEYISDVLRALNHREKWAIRYKPFWNRLAKAAFARWMKAVFQQLTLELATRALMTKKGSVLDSFTEVFLDDGSSFAVHDGLRKMFPGRFRKNKPAAIELHAHMNLLSGQMDRVSMAPDKESERKFLPPAHSLPRGSLSLRDRGYIDLTYFEDLQAAEAYLICRATSKLNPVIVRVLAGLPKKVARTWQGRRLQDLRRQKLKADLDLLLSWTRKNKPPLELRLCIRYVPEKKSWTWLLTNLPADKYSAAVVGQLYRLRWQIELVFKEWKSYASLRAFQTANASIVEGLIWASLCAALLKRALAFSAQLAIDHRKTLSARIAAMSGRQLLGDLAAWAQHGFAVEAFAEIMLFLLSNARRTHPERDRLSPARVIGVIYERKHRAAKD